MVTGDPREPQPPGDAVDQARAWLAATTGQPVPAEAGPGSSGFASRREDGGQDSTPEQRATPAGGRHTGADGRGDRGSEESPGITSGRDSARRGGPGRGTSGRGSSGHEPPDPNDPDADPENVARTIALRKLTAQARTRHELDQALQKKNVPDEVAATVLDRLEEVGLVDDKTFAEDWVASRQQRRHLSRSALRRELQGKGVDRDHVDAALAAVDTDDELAAARALVAKKAAATRGLDPQVRRRRLAGVLARRGFGAGITSTVLGELADERQELEELEDV